jgi:hypothetical protein
MSLYHNSIGHVPRVWLENGQPHRISRREMVADLVRKDCFEPL